MVFCHRVVPATNRGHRHCSDGSDWERAVANLSNTKRKSGIGNSWLFHICVVIEPSTPLSDSGSYLNWVVQSMHLVNTDLLHGYSRLWFNQINSCNLKIEFLVSLCPYKQKGKADFKISGNRDSMETANSVCRLGHQVTWGLTNILLKMATEIWNIKIINLLGSWMVLYTSFLKTSNNVYNLAICNFGNHVSVFGRLELKQKSISNKCYIIRYMETKFMKNFWGAQQM